MTRKLTEAVTPTHPTRKRTLTKHLGRKRSWKDDFTETLYLTLPRKPMEMKKRLKKASETGKMSVESVLSFT